MLVWRGHRLTADVLSRDVKGLLCPGTLSWLQCLKNSIVVSLVGILFIRYFVCAFC